jgi:hypothetical protein
MREGIQLMALTKGSFQDSQPRDPQSAADASRVYGAPGELPDATREPRMQGVAAVAAQHTSTPTAESSYADGAFELGTAKSVKQSAGSTVPSSPGFPGRDR